MNLTLAIIVFLVLVIFIFCVFSFLTYYFNKKQAQYFSPLQQEFNITNGKDDPYIDHQINSNNDKQIEMQSIKSSNLKIKLNKLSEGEKIMSDRFLNNLSGSVQNKNLTFRNPFQIGSRNQDEKKILKHVYISKLASYTERGIQLYQKQLKSIKNIRTFKNLNWVEEVKEYFDIRRDYYPANLQNFEDILDIIKLEQGEFGAIKFITEIEIKECQVQKQYNVDFLKKNEKFELITTNEYQQELEKMQIL